MQKYPTMSHFMYSKKAFIISVFSVLLGLMTFHKVAAQELTVEVTADPTSMCSQATVQLTADADGGTGNYDYSWIGNPGTFTATGPNVQDNPSVTTTYIVVVNDGENSVQDEVTVSVTSNPEADAGEDATICEDEPSYTLQGEANNYNYVEWTTSGDGSFNGTGDNVTAEYEPGDQDIENGAVDLTLHVFATPPCTGFTSDEMTLNITSQPTVDAGESQNICENEIVQLAGNATDYSQVTWTGGDGDFGDPHSLQTIYSPGENDIDNEYVELTLTADPMNPCTDVMTDQLDVDITNLPIAEAGPDDTICEGDTYTPFQANVQYGSAFSWSGNGDGEFENPNSLNPTYIPGSDDIESGEVVLTLTVSGEQACDEEEVSDEMTLTINYPPEADAGEDASICESDTYQLQPNVQYSDDVQWSTSGDGSFINDTAENAIYIPGDDDIANDEVELTITAQPITPCEEPVSDEMTLSFKPLPIVEAGETAEVCDNGSYQLSGDTIYSESVYWSSAGDGAFDDSTQINATYFPGEMDSQNGEAMLTLSATPVSPCTDTIIQDSVELAILQSPFVYAGSDNTICESGTFEPNPNDAYVEYTDTYYWSTTGDGTFAGDDTLNTLTPEYIPGEQDIAEGEVFLVLTGQNANCSDNQDSLLLSIVNEPVVEAGADTGKCVQDGTVPSFELNGYVENTTSYYWEVDSSQLGWFENDSTSIYNTLDPVFTFGPQGMTNHEVSLDLTANALLPCTNPQTDEITLTFSWHPTADAGDDGIVCAGDSIILDGTVTNAGAVSWSALNGEGGFDNATIEDPVYHPHSNDYEQGYVDLMLQVSGNGDCQEVEVRDTVTYQFQPKPLANAGEDMTICENEIAELTGTAENYSSISWQTAGTGTFEDAGVLETTYNPSTGDIQNNGVELILEAQPVTPCQGVVHDTLELTINQNPMVELPNDFTACSSQPIELEPEDADHFSQVKWSTSGDGTFSQEQTLTTHYEAGTEDVINGEVIITLTAIPDYPCSDTISDQVTLAIEEGPSIEMTNLVETEYNTSITFEPVVTGFSDTFLYEWTPADMLENPTEKNAETVVFPYDGDEPIRSYRFDFKVTDPNNNCAAEDTVRVELELGEPVIEIFADPPYVCLGGQTTLYPDVSAGTGDFSYDWAASIGSVPDVQNPTVSPDTRTTYTLTVNDGQNTSTESITIDVKDNAVTPNISGNETADQFTEEVYTTTGSDAAYYEWSAKNGSVVKGQGTKEATIEWGVAGIGYVYLQKANEFGCFGDTTEMMVNIGTSAVNEISSVDDLQVYPNPVDEVLNVTFRLKSPKHVEITLHNTMGAIVRQKASKLSATGRQEFKLDMSGRDPGLYLLKVRVGDESTLRKIVRTK